MINENYRFIPPKLNIIFKYIAYPFLSLFCKVKFGFKVIGKEKLELEQGFVTVSNHIHFMDTSLIFLSLFPKDFYFTTNKVNVETSLLRFMVRGLGGIPVPDSKRAMKIYLDSLEKLLDNHKQIHFFPEGSISPYNQNLRKLNDGAFRVAVNYNVPIVPLVFVYQKPKGILKYLRKRPFIHLIITDPIKENDYNILKTKVTNRMTEIINEHK